MTWGAHKVSTTDSASTESRWCHHCHFASSTARLLKRNWERTWSLFKRWTGMKRRLETSWTAEGGNAYVTRWQGASWQRRQREIQEVQAPRNNMTILKMRARNRRCPRLPALPTEGSPEKCYLGTLNLLFQWSRECSTIIYSPTYRRNVLRCCVAGSPVFIMPSCQSSWLRWKARSFSSASSISTEFKGSSE